MILVSVMGEYGLKNYTALFEAASKAKVTLESVEHIYTHDHFVLIAQVNGNWASTSKFLKAMSKVQDVAVQCVETMPSTNTADETYTEYNISVEIPEPHTNGLTDMISYLLNVGCIIRKVYIKTHITPFTQSTISSGCIEIAVPGTYKQSEQALEEIALVADAAHLIISVNLNLQ